MKKRILIIDDDVSINEMLSETLENEGYDVSKAYSGSEALMVLSKVRPDLILLDLMLKVISGEELLPKIKDIPVIVVSAKADTSNKVDLLLSGAVDYITKPFDIQELLARITVQLRKSVKDNNIILSYDEITLDTYLHRVSANEKIATLTRTECAILKILMQNSDKVVPKLTILDKIYDDTPDCTQESLKIHICNIRKKLQSVTNKDYISTVWGIGFILSKES